LHSDECARQCWPMFIRRTKTRDGKTGEEYFTFRLVETVRIGGAVKQRTLLNLGAHFDLPQAEWAALAGRIEELFRGQAALVVLNPAVEALARRSKPWPSVTQPGSSPGQDIMRPQTVVLPGRRIGSRTSISTHWTSFGRALSVSSMWR